MHYFISITVDADPDDTTITGQRNKLQWGGLEYVRDFREAVAEVDAVVTWFVRADDQIAHLCGSYEFLLQQHQAFWEFARRNGDEIALHPHLYTLDESGGSYRALRDPDACCEQLARIHTSLHRAGYNFESIRIGEGLQSTELMQCVDRLGYAVDSTAIPGRVRNDALRSFDWSGTTNAPYHPSRDDFRIAGPNGLGVLEVPMTTAAFKADYDSEPKLRYMSLSYRSDIFARGFEEYVKRSGSGEARSVVFIVHPGELFGAERANAHGGLYSFDLACVGANLGMALKSIASTGATYSFVRIVDFATARFDDIKWA